MTKDPVACDANEPVENVARLMRDKGVGCVIVLRNKKVVGIVTDRMLATSVIADGLGADTAVEEVMHQDPACVNLDDNVFAIIDTMRSAGVVRRVPVVNELEQLVGIVSISDIAVIAKDLTDAMFLETTHNAMQEAKVLTGAKRIVKDIRRPTNLDRLPPDQPTRPVTEPAQGSAPAKSANANQTPHRR